jgi:hypothetical protein
LDVNGNIHVSGQISKDVSGGTMNRATPIAYGVINSAGSVASGTPNVSSTWNGTDNRYEITISGENYFWSSYVTVVTVSDTSPYVAVTDSVSNKLLVYIYNLSGVKTSKDFQFVTYKP